ncbi:MAG: hypothetical protein IJ039_00480 [Clostridia bacterium]|nr:hypothetical protein [Clostridia bacterium]
MKRISLLLCFVLLVMAMFAISAFAATSENVVKDATLAEDGGCGDASLEMIRDGDVNTAASCGSAASWVNFHFLYADGINVSKVVVVVNSTGNVYYDSEGVAKSIKEYTELSALPNIYLRLYNSASSTAIYALENVAASKFAAATDDEGNTLYTTYTFDLGGVIYSDITKVEIATVHGGSNEMGVWEVEIYDYNCVNEADHNYSAATCTTKATCAYCGETTGEVSTEHTWVEATCAAPKTCTVCGTTEGEVDESKHIWKNASYTAPKTCKTCGATEGDVWVDSALTSFVRGDEGDTITYDDIIGEVELIAGSTGNGAPEYVLDGIAGVVGNLWGGPTDSAIKITLKNEWEITEAKAILATNWCAIKFSFYAADGTLLGEKNSGWLSGDNIYFLDQANYSKPETLTYTDFSSAVSGLAYGDDDKAVKYIIITDAGGSWSWTPAVLEVYFTGRERIPTACENHVFEEKVLVEPTCTTDGSKQNVCTVCGVPEGAVSIPALDHDFSEYRIKTPATCITAPVIEFECIRCGQTVERNVNVDDVTEYINIADVANDGIGGWNPIAHALFDNDLNTRLMVGGGWFAQSATKLDMNYYISSVTVWVGLEEYSDSRSNSAWLIFYYKDPGSDEWKVGGKTPTPATYKGTKYEYTLELSEPVYTSEIMIYVGGSNGGSNGGGPGLCSYNGVVYEAKVTGSTMQEVADGHTWVAGEVVAPTCDDFGYTIYTCSDCGATKKGDIVRETGHSWVNATCTVAKTCSTCSATSGDPLGHDMSVAATCTTPLSCSRCDYTEGEALGHTWTDATCTTAKTCSVCSETEGEALGHTWVDATCTTAKTCSVCSATEGEALGEHIYDLANATTENNVISIACSYDCGLVATVTVDGTTATAGFNSMAYQNVITVDTPEYGKLTLTSSEGSACYMMTNPRMPAQLVSDPIIVNADGFNTSYILIPSFDATATEAPSITITYETITPATVVVGANTVETGAAQTKVQFNATAGMYYFTADAADVYVLDAYGSTTAYADTLFTFAEDQVVYILIYPYAETVTLTITKHEHSYVDTVVDVTCTTNGYTLHECSCGDSYTTDEVDAAGAHSFTYGDDYVYVSSTCKEAGYASDKCSVCGESFTVNYEIDTEYGHAWGDESVRNEADTGYVQTCELCGATQETITKGTVNEPVTAVDGANTYVLYDSNASGVIYQYTASGYGKLVITFETNGSVIYSESLMVFMRGMMFQTSATEYTFIVEPDNLVNNVCYFAVSAGVESFNVSFVATERPVLSLGDNNIDATSQGTKVTISTPGDYILSAPNGANVSILLDEYSSEMIELPYSFTVAEGETVTFVVGTSSFSVDYEVVVLTLEDANPHVHTEVEIPAVPATKANSGWTSGVECSECGEVIVAPEEVVYDTLKVGALTLTLGENINVVYKNVIGSDYTDVYVVFKLNTADGDLEYTVTDYETDEKGRYCFTFEGVRLQFMADNIEATIYAKTASGLEAVSSYPTYSVKQYIVNQLGKSTDAEFKTMISDLLVLGDKAQVYANYKTDSLMTADVTNLTASTFDGVDASENVKGYIGEKSTVADWKTMTLLVGNATTIRYTVQVAESELDNVVIVLSLGTEGEAGYRREEFKASELKLAAGYTDRYVIEFTNMNVSAYGKTVTGVILHNGEQIGREYYYSVNSYLYSNQDVSDAVTKDFLRAMYQYGESALAYVNN